MIKAASKRLVLSFKASEEVTVSELIRSGLTKRIIYDALVLQPIPIVEMRTSEIKTPNNKSYWVYLSGSDIKLRITKSGFQDSDVLRLTENGQNILYDTMKEIRLTEVAERSADWAKKSAILTAIGILVSIFIGCLTIYFSFR